MRNRQLMDNLGNSIREISLTQETHFKVKCISLLGKRVSLTKGKKYSVNQVSRLTGNYRVKCDSGRNVWYSKSHFLKV